MELYLLVVRPLKVLVLVSILAAAMFSVTLLIVRCLVDQGLAGIIASERWETDPIFPKVPSHLRHSWKEVMADRWFFDDDNLRLEAWALVKAAERAAHIQRVHDRRILSLSDNLSTVLSFNRGRPATSNS